MTCVCLVLGPGSAQLRDLIATAGKRRLTYVCLADGVREPELAAAGEVLGELLPLPEEDPTPTIAALREREVEGVVTFSDSRLVLTATLARALGLPGMSPAAALRVRSKYHQRRALNTNGVGAVSTTRLPAGAVDGVDLANIPYPAILKPDEGTGAAWTARVDGPEQLVATVGRLSNEPMVIEAMLPPGRHPYSDWLGDMVSVDSVVAGGELWHFGIAARFPAAAPFRETGIVFPSLLSAGQERALLDVTELAISALELDNTVTHTELKLTNGSGIVIEVNARMGGYVQAGWSRAAVGNPMEAAFDVALGVTPRLPTPLVRHVAGRIVHAPQSARRIVDAPEPDELLQLPGVWRVERNLGPGDAVDWRNGAVSRVFDVWLEADGAEELRAVDHALSDALARGLSFDR